jgi:hypothetical protein
MSKKPKTLGDNLQTAGQVASAVGIVLATIGAIILLLKRGS